MLDIECFDLNIVLFKHINGFNNPPLDVFFYLTSYLGYGLIVIPIIFILYRIEKRKILPIISSFLISGIIVQVIKHIWSIPRPFSLIDDIHIVGETLEAGSFPSGHTATAMALFYVLSTRQKRFVKVIFLIPAIAVGYSRIYMGAHFPLDVLGGGLIGLLAGYVSIKYNEFIKKNKIKLLVIFFIPAVLFFYRLDAFPFYILDEAHNAEAAREMLEQSDLLVPTYNYELRTDKPPLHYWLSILAYKLLGVSELSSRIGSAIVGVLTVFLVYLFAAKVLNRKTALISALILPTCLYSFLTFRMCIPDPYLVFFSTLALFSFYLSISKPAYIYVFYVASGLGTLAKGPVGFILPFGVALAFVFFRGMMTSNINAKGIPNLVLSGLTSLKVFFTSKHIAGLIIAAMIAIPWYVLVSIKTDGEFASAFFLKHNLGRFLSPMQGHGGPFYVTVLFLLLGFFPWSFFIAQVLLSSFRQKREPLQLFLFLWVILYIIFYAISATKLPQYLVPVYPALSILTAEYLSQDLPYKKVSAAFIGAAGLSVCAALFIFGNKYAGAMMPWLALLGLPFLLCGIITLISNRYIYQTIAISTIIFLLLVSGWFMPVSEKYFIPKKIVHIIKEIQKSRCESINSVYSWGYYDPAFAFYSRGKIIKIKRLSLLYKGDLLISTEDKLEASNLKYRNLFKIRDPIRNKNVVIIQIEG